VGGLPPVVGRSLLKCQEAGVPYATGEVGENRLEAQLHRAAAAASIEAEVITAAMREALDKINLLDQH
jgi:hypothetical protein